MTEGISESWQRFVLAFLLAVGVGAMVSVAGAMPVLGQDSDITRGEVRNFDRFLDNHPEVAEQLRSNPSLIKNEDFLEKHPELREWLKNHPEAREELKEDPRAFINRERHFERSGGDITRPEAAQFDRFLDKHPEVAEGLQKNPSLINNPQWLAKHPQLQSFLSRHPAVAKELKENPRAFMRRERRFEKHEGREGRLERREGRRG